MASQVILSADPSLRWWLPGKGYLKGLLPQVANILLFSVRAPCEPLNSAAWVEHCAGGLHVGSCLASLPAAPRNPFPGLMLLLAWGTKEKR